MIYVMGGGGSGGLIFRAYGISGSTHPSGAKVGDVHIDTATALGMVRLCRTGQSGENGDVVITADNNPTTGSFDWYLDRKSQINGTFGQVYQKENGIWYTKNAWRYNGSNWVKFSSAFSASITVNTQTGCTCRVYSSNGLSYSNNATNWTSWTTSVPTWGTWTVEIAKGGKTKSTTVSVDQTNGKNYSVSLQMNTVPQFTYSGSYSLTDDSGNTLSQDESTKTNWKITFTSSGNLVFTDLANAANGIDIHCVGGGAACGGGGYTTTTKNASVSANTTYAITIGSGGSGSYVNGNPSSFGSLCTAAGGKTANGGDGGSGAGANGAWAGAGGGNGGSNGGNGGLASGSGDPGSGQGTTTRDFGEPSGTLRAGGGGGRNYNAGETRGEGGAGGGGRGGDGGTPSTAGNGTDYYGGGSGKGAGTNQRGGCGIVIIRNKR